MRETHKCVISHINKARSIPDLEEATAVLVLESNLAFEAQHLIHALNTAKLRRWVALSEGAGGTVGWLTVSHALCTQKSTIYRRPRLCPVRDVADQ